MATNFPSNLDSLVNPQPADEVSKVSHSGQHSDVNDAIEAIETKLGVDNSTSTASIDYLLTSAQSTNPGHRHQLHTGAIDLIVSSTELNYSSGLTGTIQNQLDAKVGVPISPTDIANGLITTAEFERLDGVTSTIQNQINDIGSSGGFIKTDGTNPLTANWNAGAFDISLQDLFASSITDYGDLSVSGTANITGDVQMGGNITGGTWQASLIQSQYGGVGKDTSGDSGMPKVTGGTWTINATQDDLGDGTTYKQYNPALVNITGGSGVFNSLKTGSADITGGQIDGITLTNLIDKSATESITGHWSFSAIDITGGTGVFTSLKSGSANITGGQINGIVVGNLVDKSVAEAITGHWSLTSLYSGSAHIAGGDVGGVAPSNLVDKSATETITGYWDVNSLKSGSAHITGNINANNLVATSAVFVSEVDNGSCGNYGIIDFSTGNKQKIEADLAAGTICLKGLTGPANVILRVHMGTANVAINWDGSGKAVKWPAGTAPTPSATQWDMDIFSFYYDTNTWYGNASQAFA